eukprot:scaffold3.g6398.t1
METWEFTKRTHSYTALPAPPSPRAGGRHGAAAADAQSWCDTSHLSDPTDGLGGEEEESPGAYEYECFLSASRAAADGGECAIRHQGWLLKAYGRGPQRRWRRRWVYLTADRLCYTSDPTVDGVRYVPLDRIPVRALPRGYGPKIAVCQLDEANPSSAKPHRVGCVFSVACGSHTHFLAAETPAAAKEWVDRISEAWIQCVKHTARGGHLPSGEEVLAFKEARWKAEAGALRRSLADVRASAEAREGEYWHRWAAAEAKLKALEAAQGQPAPAAAQAGSVAYEIQVVTGDVRGGGTTSKVFLELAGEAGASGEYRLMYKNPERPVFQRGGTDTFKLHCGELGPLASVRVFHDNSGAAPGWFLQEVRVRRRGAAGGWTVFPCGRWLAADQDDGRVMRDLPCSGSPAAAKRLGTAPAGGAAWYQLVVCTSDLPDAGTSSEVWVALHGSRGSSARVHLPAQAGDFGRGQEDVFRVQLAGVGAPERLSVGLSGQGAAPDWHLEQVEVTEEATGETVFFPCGLWLSSDKARDGAAAERTLLGTRANPRRARELEVEARRLSGLLEAAKGEAAAKQAEADRLRAELEEAGGRQAAAGKQLSETQQENGMLREQSSTLAARLARQEAAAAALEGELVAARGELAAARTAERAAGAERARLEQQLASRRAEAADAEQAAGPLREQLSAKAAELARLRSESAALRAREEDLVGELEESRAALRRVQREHDALRRAGEEGRGSAEERAAQLAAELAAAKARLAEAQRAKADAERAASEGAARESELAIRLREAAAAAAAAAVAPPPPALPPVATSPPRPVALEEAGPSLQAGPAKVRYSCRMWVKDTSGPVQPDSLCLTLVGSKGESGVQTLDITAAVEPASAQRPPHRGPPQVVAAAFSASDVGRMQLIRVGLVAGGGGGVHGAGGSPAASASSPGAAARPCGVLLAKVALFCSASGEAATFHCTPEVWLSSQDDFDYEFDAAPAAAAGAQGRGEGGGPCRYRVEVQTSDLRRAGTRGHVYLTVLGDHGAAGPFMLSNAGGAHFQRGQLDAFEVGAAPDVGTIRQVEVRHDAVRRRGGWHLAWVKVGVEAARAGGGRVGKRQGAGLWMGVTNETTAAVAMFPCSRWIDRQQGDPAVVAVAAPVPPYGKALATEDAAGGGDEEAGPEGEPGYQISFHTSRLCMSGTNARPYFELVGARGSSGIMHPVGTDRSFKPGRLPALGRLQALRVGTDGTGLFPAWLLNWVEVTHLPTSQRWVFGLSDWISKKHKYAQWMALDQTPEGPVPGGKPAGKWGAGLGGASTFGAYGPAAYGGGQAGGGQIGAYHPPTSTAMVPVAGTLPQQPYRQGGSISLPQQQQQQRRPHWGGGPAAGGSPGRRKAAPAVAAPGGGHWGAARAMRPGSPAASQNSILEVLASPHASPLATGGRYQAAW